MSKIRDEMYFVKDNKTDKVPAFEERNKGITLYSIERPWGSVDDDSGPIRSLISKNTLEFMN